MTDEELERLYMDIYDNGILDYSYKEKFKRYINNRLGKLGKLEKENEELKVENAFCEKACEGATMMYEHLTKAKELLKDITSSYGSTEVSEAQMCLKIKKAEIFLKELGNDCNN